MAPHTGSALPRRSRAAVYAGRTVAGASKLSHLGSGSVIGGRVALALDPELLARVLAGRRVVLVSGTNGKTTTTHLLTAALATLGRVATNDLGANMPPGIVAALGRAAPGGSAALEVDEQWLPAVLEAAGPATVILLNLSRDQLDRAHEVRKTADRWRSTLATHPTEHVVANADDPLVVWAADGAGDVVWVATGTRWTLDAAGCPSCGGRIEFADDGWHCSVCSFTRPEPAWWVEGAGADAELVGGDGTRRRLDLALPGHVNATNAAMVLAAVDALGADLADAVAAVGRVRDVAGRYRHATIAGVDVRMLLAKNPAGWQEAIDMAEPPPTPVVAAINARIADGRDPSWLWDVPYERLRGRLVVATGERRHDLAVRLRYAEVDHAVAADLTEAVRRAAGPSGADHVDLIANYTAFQDYLAEVGGPSAGGHRG
ncbi:MAG: MurT ligase domain-containing protein [Acidimicrobiales bacterium]